LFLRVGRCIRACARGGAAVVVMRVDTFAAVAVPVRVRAAAESRETVTAERDISSLVSGDSHCFHEENRWKGHGEDREGSWLTACRAILLQDKAARLLR
jgi:hypothetical protein